MQLDVMCSPLPLAQMQEFARHAEKTGFDSLYITEGGRTAYLSCAAAALATRKLGIGTAVALAFNRSPMTTAQIAWELADASKGRFVLGLGTQVKTHIERRYGMQYDPPGPRLKEHILAVKAIFAAFAGKEKLNFEGKYHTHTFMTEQWNPGPIDNPDIPIYVSAVRPWMSKMAGEICDGVHIHPFHSPEYVSDEMLPHISEGADKAGRSMADITLEFHTMTATGDSEEEISKARDHARTMVAFYGTTPPYSPVFEKHGFDGMTQKLREQHKAGNIDKMKELITDDILDCYCVSAEWGSLAQKLVERYGGIAPSVRVMTYSASTQWRQNPEVFDRWADVAKEMNNAGKTGKHAE